MGSKEIYHPCYNTDVKNKRALFIILLITIILLLPLIAIRFSDEVIWDLPDFVIMGILLSITGFGFELILKKVKNRKIQIFFIFILITLFLYVWAELAVGIFTHLGS